MIRRAVLALAVLCAGPAVAAAAAAYGVDPAGSHVDFVGVQAGADFKGTFHKFSAAIEFSPDALDSSHFEVQIDLNSVDTMDNDRDGTIRGPDLFDVAHFPGAKYVTRGFARTAAGYSAAGVLTLHGVAKDVPIEFRFTPSAGGAKLEGTARLKRLDFGVGRGDWKSTEGVSDEVRVVFSLLLKPKA